MTIVASENHKENPPITQTRKQNPLHFVRWRIVTTFGALCILLVAMLLLTYTNLETLKKELQIFNDSTLKTQLQVNSLSGMLAEMTALEQTYVITGKETDAALYNDKKEAFDQQIATLQKEFSTAPNELKYIETILAYYTTYVNTSQQAMNIRKEDGLTAAQAYVTRGVGQKAINNVNQQIDYMTTVLNKQSKAKLTNLEKSTSMSETIFFSLTLIAIIVLSATGFLLFTSIKRNTRRIQQAIDQMASNSGDLTRRITITTKDEFAQIGHSTNQLIASIAALVGRIENLSDEVAHSGQALKTSAAKSTDIMQAIADSSDIISTSSEQTIKHMNRAAQKMDLLHHTTSELSSDTIDVKKSASAMIQVAKDGYNSVQNAANMMMEIEETIAHTTDTVQKLGHSSAQITSIIQTITDIADQTNLLALNASIEAARAGEAGKGFAVVADEVRKLAESSQTAANEVTNMISSIQQEINTIVAQNNVGVQKVINGVTVTNETTSSLDMIVAQTTETLAIIDEMAGKITQFETHSNDVTQSFIEVNMIAEENAMQAEENAKATVQGAQSVDAIYDAIESLSAQSDELQQMINAFKVR